MEIEEVSENVDWRGKQRERERERRRIRDRQRRQSMSVEEREKHLARRRRNYQLRRQRAAVMMNNHSSNGFGLEISDEHLAIVPVTELDDVQSNGVSSLGFIEGFEDHIGSSTRFEGTEASSSNYPRKLRLHQIRHLARLLNTSLHELNTSCLQFGVASTTSTITQCDSRKRLRLVHVKRLARALNSTLKRALDENPQSAGKGNQDMVEPEIQMIRKDTLENENLCNNIDDDEL